jgi:signal transduction histidine kinase
MARIIIAEDNPQDRRLLEALLGGAGHHVRTAPNGAEALALARQQPPDLLLTDVLMPVMDGYALCAAWREDPALTMLPIIVLSGTYTDEQDEALALRLGAVRFLRKPTSREQLLSTVSAVLSGPPPEAPRARPAPDEDHRLYNQRLVEKLEARTAHLEQSRREVAALQARLTFFLERSPTIIYAMWWDGERWHATWISDNVERLLGYTPAEALAPGWWFDHVHPDDLRSALAHNQRIRLELVQGRAAGGAETQAVVGEYRFRRKSGDYIWIRDEVVADEDGQVIGSWNDITREREAERSRSELNHRLMQAMKMDSLGALAGGVAHDFNNFLVVVLSYAELVLEALPEQDPLRSDVEEILNAAERSRALTSQLLAFSRQQLLECAALDLSEVLAELSKMLQRLLGDQAVLEVEVPTSLPRVWMDRGQLDQILINLAVNARDAMPQGGRVTISAGRPTPSDTQDLELDPEGFVCIRVTDEGTGISPEIMPHIFEPFFTTKPQGRGTGLGLSTVYGIVEQAGGKVHVRSKLDYGTTFSICLPVADSGGQEVRETMDLSEEQLGGTETVLVVEDEPAVRRIAHRTLSRAGYNVLTADNAGSALLMCERHPGPIDLILSDVMMPMMTGPELAERLRRIRPDALVLFMTGHTSLDEAQANLLEASAVLRKPFTPKVLLRRVRLALSTAGE